MTMPEAYDEYDGPLCRCGHYLDEHHPRGKCYGTVGDDECTCQGHCEAKRTRR